LIINDGQSSFPTVYEKYIPVKLKHGSESTNADPQLEIPNFYSVTWVELWPFSHLFWPFSWM